MLHPLLFAPFNDSARQAQFLAVQAALDAAPTAAPVVLLGNFEVGEEVVDALLVRPHSVVVLLFVPQGGHLDIPNQHSATWHLDEYTLQGDEHAANPFEQFLRQQEAVAAWLTDTLGPVPPDTVQGLVLFAGPVQFGPGVETYLRRQPGAENFQLLPDFGQLARRLYQLREADLRFSTDDLLAWFQTLTTAPEEPATDGSPTPGGFWEQKARQLWRWLGAEDIPHDAPYGSAAAAVAAGQQEKQRLEQLSEQVRQELTQQRQQMEAREAERERSIEQLRAQLQQAPSAAAEVAALQARLAIETQEKQQLEAAIRASQTEAAARNQELDARIRQLGQLIEQLQARPAAPVPPAAAPPAPTPAAPPKPAPVRAVVRPTTAAPASRPVLRPSWRVPWPRVLVIGVVAAGLGLGTWGLVRVAGNRAASSTTVVRPPEPGPAEEATATPPSLVDIQPDTVLVDANDEPVEPSRPARSAPEDSSGPNLDDSTQADESASPEPATDSSAAPISDLP